MSASPFSDPHAASQASRQPCLLAHLGLTLFLAVGVGAGATASGASTEHVSGAPSLAKPTIVLVHGGWADWSGWNGEISRLHKRDYRPSSGTPSASSTTFHAARATLSCGALRALDTSAGSGRAKVDEVPAVRGVVPHPGLVLRTVVEDDRAGLIPARFETRP